MKSSEEAIERVLTGLRDAEAPAGMERRILDQLDRLEERAAARSRMGWRQWLPVWLVAPARPVAVGSLACGAALAGIFVVALGIPALRRLGHAPEQSKKNIATVKLPPATNSEVAKRAQAGSFGSAVRSSEEIKIVGKSNAGSAEVVIDGDAVALEAMYAPSQPAPPMPLTDQERLLLRLVHEDDPVEMAMLEAMLDSKLRALQDSKDKAEFQGFFEQSAKRTTPEQSMAEQAATQQSTTEQVAQGQSATGQSATEQAMPDEAETEQPTSEQQGPEQQVPEQPAQPQTKPEKPGPDQSTTQEATPKPTGTGEYE